MAVTAEKHVVYYHVFVAGEQVDERQIREIIVTDYLMLPDVCTLTHMLDDAKGLDRYSIGDTLEVKIGARDEATTSSIFKGEIVTLVPDFKDSIELTVRAYDRAHRLHRSRQVRGFQNQTASDIVTSICVELGLQAQTDASGSPYEYIQQDNETDWDFIWRLARRIGFEFYVEDGVAHFQKPSGESVAELEWGKGLHAFRPRLTAVAQPAEIKVNGWDPLSAQTVTATKATPDQQSRIGIARNDLKSLFGDAKVQVSTTVVENEAEAGDLAQTLLNRYANAYVQAQGTAEGNPKIRAGSVVTVKGIGTKYSGTYRVDTSRHILRGGGMYVTEFFNTPAATVSESLGAGSGGGGRPAIGTQLVVGLVTNSNDPEELGRIRVQIPALGDDNESGWARVAVPSAGKERGLMMLPMVGDEVLIGFEHGDTRRPFVIGSLYNGEHTPGEELADGDKGGFAVRSDDKLFMRSKKAMTISSDDVMTVEISGDVTEKHGGAHTTEVTKDLKIKAMNITLEGTSAIEIKGVQVTIEATGALALKGATVDISGKGPVGVSGTPIKLN